MLVRMLSGFLIVAFVGCGPDAGAEPPASVVVDVDWLKENLDAPNVQPVDARGTSAFGDGRIPGAIRLTPEQLAMSDGDVPSQVAPAAQAETVLRAAGLRNGSIVVVYGEPPEYDPARIVWTLEYYGHGDVHYLDGGYPAWVGAGGTVDSGAPTTEATDYAITDIQEQLRVTGDWVLSELGSEPYDMPAIQLVDARSATEYDAGRIPSALHVQWGTNLDDGFLRSMAEIQALHEGFDPAQTTVAYCLIGWRGSLAWLALKHLGYEDVRLYDGSWAEWGNGQFPTEP